MTTFDNAKTRLYVPPSERGRQPAQREAPRRKPDPRFAGALRMCKDASTFGIQAVAIVVVLRWVWGLAQRPTHEPGDARVGAVSPRGIEATPEASRPVIASQPTDVSQAPTPAMQVPAITNQAPTSTQAPAFEPTSAPSRHEFATAATTTSGTRTPTPRRKDPVDRARVAARSVATGTLGVSHGPDATPARLTIDGRSYGYTPIITEVAAGEHRVRLTWTDGKVFEQVIAVKAGDYVKSIGLEVSAGHEPPKTRPSRPPHSR